ncbi:MAG: NACHT domain-containing protein [Cyanobacteria bacterium P01_G01_bin.38]
MEYNFSKIRELINKLGDDEFLNLCQDSFPSVDENFTSGQTKNERIRLLIDYVKRQDEVRKLLEEIKIINPNAFTEFEEHLVINSNIDLEYSKFSSFSNKKPVGRSDEEVLLLNDIRQNIKGRLAKTFSRSVKPINLKKDFQPQLVNCPWTKHIKIGSRISSSNSQENILEIFDSERTAHKLLITGAPGSGKTTTLLELAKKLSDRAYERSSEPIPVPLSLISWEGQNISEWISSEAHAEYTGSIRNIKLWLDEQKLLVILDGLDELNLELQAQCIEKINEFLRRENKPIGLVVCSRKDEYLSRKTLLELNEAVYLLPLEDNQIEGFLNENRCNSLWEIFSREKNLLELVRTPLFLSISLIAHRNINYEEWNQANSLEESLKLIWDSYIHETLINHIRTEKDYGCENLSLPKVLTWLRWLAIQSRKSENKFTLSDLQPYKTLNNKSKKTYYVLLFAVIFSIIELVVFVRVNFEVDLVVTQILQLSSFATSVVLTSSFGEVIQPIEKILSSIEITHNLKILKISVLFALIMSAFSGAYYNLDFNFSILSLALIELMFFAGAIFCSLTTITLYLIKRLPFFDSLFNSIRLPAILSSILLLSYFVLISSSYFVLISLVISFPNPVVSGFMFFVGGTFGTFAFFGKFQWIWFFGIGFLPCIYISIIAYFIAFSWLIGDTKNSFYIAANVGLISGLFMQTVLLSRALKGATFSSSNESSHPNQSIKRTMKNASIISVFFGFIAAIISGPSYGISFGLVTWLISGGIACIQHFLLRLILALEGYIPWNYKEFLNYATDRILLRRVGGSYKFIHLLLQDHLLKTPLDENSTGNFR